MKRNLSICLILILLPSVPSRAAALSILHEDSPGSVKLVLGDTVADIYVDTADAKLPNIAAGLLAEDVQRVTGKLPNLLHDPTQLSKQAIIIGSIGHSALIDQLIAANKIDVTDIQNQWETYKLQVVANPLPNVDTALVIVGSDRRGTAFGVFTLSQAIGVSPWYWWADVPPTHADNLVIPPATTKDGPPSIKYRGIFINDEDWGLNPWAAKTFDPQFKNIGPKTYAKVFELLLRLKMNYIWPAMHPVSTEFGKIYANLTLADDWGIVAGASHPEGMNRNNVDWPKMHLGEWRFDTNRQNMLNFWEEWAKRRGPYEAVWTIGMRGVHDAPMLGPPDMPGKVKLLEQAIAAQRGLLTKFVNPDITKVPQLFCPYKEALQQYRAGLQVPPDVTICWTEDNFGYIRQLSTPDEQKRPGGSGVYYHISYLGSPFSYVWLNTTPPALIWEEMTKAYAYGADRLWVLNVGDIKPGEIGIQFWADLGWNINAYQRQNLPNFLTDWATNIFGSEQAPQIAAVMNKYYRLGFARKPESLYRDPNCFSTANYNEAQQRLAEYQALSADAGAIDEKLPKDVRDAYFELVLYPVRSAAMTNQAFIAASLSKFYADQGNPLANTYATMVDQALAQINSDTNNYNDQLANGKWRNMIMAKGTNNHTFGFDWPHGTKLTTSDQQPPIPTVTATDQPPIAPHPSFTEKDGYVSIEAEHATNNISRSGAQWQIIPGLGRTSDCVAVFPVTTASIDDPKNLPTQSPELDYDITTTSTGPLKATTYCVPTRRINATRGLRYAISVDDQPPQIVDFNEPTEGPQWSKNVLRDAAINSSSLTLSSPGKHQLKIWMVDPGVVLEKIVLDFGGAKDSYFGPPETLASVNP